MHIGRVITVMGLKDRHPRRLGMCNDRGTGRREGRVNNG